MKTKFLLLTLHHHQLLQPTAQQSKHLAQEPVDVKKQLLVFA
jgi:hypothetical protein